MYFKIINYSNEITHNNNWNSASKFDCKDRIVNDKGKKVNADYQGHRFQIIEKMERNFTRCERFKRGLLGVVVVVSTLGLAIFFKSVRHLFVKSKKNIRYAIKVSDKQPQVISVGKPLNSNSLDSLKSSENTLITDSMSNSSTPKQKTEISSPDSSNSESSKTEAMNSASPLAQPKLIDEPSNISPKPKTENFSALDFNPEEPSSPLKAPQLEEVLQKDIQGVTQNSPPPLSKEKVELMAQLTPQMVEALGGIDKAFEIPTIPKGIGGVFKEHLTAPVMKGYSSNGIYLIFNFIDLRVPLTHPGFAKEEF